MPISSHPSRRTGIWHQLIRLLVGGLLLAGLLPAQAGQLVLDTYYHNDHLGSPTAATDERGDLLWRAHYRPYGERQEAPKSERFGNLGYTGHAQDADSQLVYAGARYYDPLIGRFLAVDPAPVAASAPGSFNRYNYTFNNPYRFTDPNGESPSPADVYHFAVDVGSLLVQEAVYVAAVAVDEPAVANLAIEGIVEARVDAAISTAGLISPAPGVAPTLKAARGIKGLKEQASDLVPLNNGKHRVTLRSEKEQLEIDLAGKDHAGIPTPHTKVSPRNTHAPEHSQPAYNTSNKTSTTRASTQEDIRKARRYLERQGR